MSPVWPPKMWIDIYIDPDTPLTRDERTRLPKAKLFSIRFGGWMRPIKTRGANFAAVYIGPLRITWRMPWIPRVARQLHPEIFA